MTLLIHFLQRKIFNLQMHRLLAHLDTCIYSQCANHLHANRNLRYSKWWPSFLLCCFWRVVCVYEELILLWFCLLDSIFKQHYSLTRFIRSEVLCFSKVSESPNLTRIQTHHLRIGHVTLIKYKYRQLYDKGKVKLKKKWICKSDCNTFIELHMYILAYYWIFFSFSESRVCMAPC